MTDIYKQTRELCRLYNITPARSRGQNFLIKEEVYDKIVGTAELKKDDIVLEVGPGLGFLTAKLAKKVKKVIAVELDDKLAEILRTGFLAQGVHPVKSLDSSQGAPSAFNRVKNVEVVNENILDIEIDAPLTRGVRGVEFKKKQEPPLIPPYQGGESGGFKIVANLPYNITSIFLRKFLSAENKPELMVLMLQKEVAERICALPREIHPVSRPSGISRGRPPKMSLLAVSVQFYAKPEIIEYVSKENFWPKPEVDSAIIKIKIKSPQPPFVKGGSREEVGTGHCPVPTLAEKEFFKLVKIGFSAKRKMLKNNLAAGYQISQLEAEDWLKNAGFNSKIRAQELSVEDWKKLLVAFR